MHNYILYILFTFVRQDTAIVGGSGGILSSSRKDSYLGNSSKESF